MIKNTSMQPRRSFMFVPGLRPDQHIAHILPVTAHDALAAFFDAFMIKQNQDDKLFDPSKEYKTSFSRSPNVYHIT